MNALALLFINILPMFTLWVAIIWNTEKEFFYGDRY